MYDNVKFILSLPGVDSTARNNEAVQLAAENGHVETVKLLLEQPGVKISDMEQAFMKAAKLGCDETVEFLLSLIPEDEIDENILTTKREAEEALSKRKG